MTNAEWYFNKQYYILLQRLLHQPDYEIINRSGEKVYELLDISFRLYNPSNCFAECRGMSFSYLEGELEFYLSGSPYLKDISKYSKFWERCSDDGRTINSNYGKLLLHDRNLHNYTQFEYAKEMLLRNPDSKKAVMVIYSPQNAFKSNDNPCTMFLQFFIRNNGLMLFVKMRSSDIWFGLPYDVPFFVLVLHKMYLELVKEKYSDLGIHSYNHQSMSLHLYERNRAKALEVVKTITEESLLKNQYDLFADYVESRL